MKAIVFTKYGNPETLILKEVPKPVPKDNEVLIKIVSTAINDYDWGMVRGKPYVYRLLFGILKPKNHIPGMELAGIVSEVGPSVKKFKIGDEVYGDISEYGFGTYAEFISINENAVIKKPKSMGFEEATALPHASLLALQALHDIGKIEKRQKILINGGGGGVGTFGLQFAKSYGCEVTGVDTGDKLEMMVSIGFDKVIDYKKENFTKNGEQYDLILDCKTNRSPFAYARCLNTNGFYVTVGGMPLRLIQILLLSKLFWWGQRKNLKLLSLKPNKGLDLINELYTQGNLKCIIDGPHPLKNAPQLLRYFGEGKHKGKVVLTI